MISALFGNVTMDSTHVKVNARVVMYMTNRSIPDVILSREFVFRSTITFLTYI